jgi:hypothetical protein
LDVDTQKISLDAAKQADDKQAKEDSKVVQESDATVIRAKGWYKSFLADAKKDGISAIELYKLIKTDLA